MIRSMTGYGRYENITDAFKLTVELKSVNHKYFDLNIRMPKLFNRFEGQIRLLLKDYIGRGKVDLFITYENYGQGGGGLKYNRGLAAEYLKYCREMVSDFGIQDDIKVSVLARFPDVLMEEETSVDEDELWDELSAGLREAAGQFVRSREAEGENLKTDLLSKLEEMLGAVALIEERSPAILEEYREKLRSKVKELLASSGIDEGRIAAEVTLYADRICVDEEMVRLHSHIDAMRKELTKGGAIGRKLDFLAQEMNREANTTLSKSGDLTVSDAGIFLKTTIEKIREQVQNIE